MKLKSKKRKFSEWKLMKIEILGMEIKEKEHIGNGN